MIAKIDINFNYVKLLSNKITISPKKSLFYVCFGNVSSFFVNFNQ